ncbi:MAG: hypothetical protein ACW992_12105, partial [Candidatus Thorarchaeota archaeon]
MKKSFAFIALLMLISTSQIGLAYKESDQLNGGQTTHQFIMDRIHIILQNDGYPYLANFLMTYT